MRFILKFHCVFRLVGSFSWMVFPNTSGLLPDRWITIFGIFLFHICQLMELLLLLKKAARPKIVSGAMLAPFAMIGMLFALSPNDPALTTLSPYHEFIGQFTPNDDAIQFSFDTTIKIHYKCNRLDQS